MKKLALITSGAYLTIISSALAAEEKYYHGETAHKLEEAIEAAEHTSEGGLPQFDPEWFASQVFWLFISFTLLYVIFAKKTLPDISSVIENRKNHIQSDLETAEQLTAEADNVHDAYQENLTLSQNKAAEELKLVENAAKSKTEASIEKFRLKSDEALKDAENRIEQSKADAMDDMNQITIDTAAQAVEKIIGVKADAVKIKSIVTNMSNDRKAQHKVKAA